MWVKNSHFPREVVLFLGVRTSQMTIMKIMSILYYAIPATVLLDAEFLNAFDFILRKIKLI